jgi:hypothetical protein
MKSNFDHVSPLDSNGLVTAPFRLRWVDLNVGGKLTLYGHGGTGRKGFGANLYYIKHFRPRPLLEFTIGDILSFS